MQATTFFLSLIAVLMTGCGTGEKPATLDDFYTRDLTLPNRKVIKAEVVSKPQDMMRGMMFRDSLAPDRGMLFFHGKAGKYPYWTYQVRIPLDILWLDHNQLIVEISKNTPPCPSTSSSKCPRFGGTRPAQYVLELAGGMADQYNLKTGDKIDF